MCLLATLTTAATANRITLNGEANRVTERNSTGSNSTTLSPQGGAKEFNAKLSSNGTVNSSNTSNSTNTAAIGGRQRLILVPRQRGGTPSKKISPLRVTANNERNALSLGSSNGHAFGLSENVVLSSKDAEREAQLLYEKSLKEFHESIKAEEGKASEDIEERGDGGLLAATSTVSSTMGNDRKITTVHSICNVWAEKHCQCSGILGRLSITCRNIGILAVPVNLPADTVTL